MSIPGFVYPVIPSQYAGSIFGLVFQYSQFERASADSQERLQLAQLRALAEHAYRAAPFWRLRLESIGWAPGQPFDRATLQALPPLTRADLRQNFEALKAEPLDPAWGAIDTVATSGSTGEPVTVARATVQGLLFDAATVLDHVWHQRNFARKFGMISADIKENVSAPNWGPPVAALFGTGPAVALASTGSDPVAELDWLDAEKPDYLATQPRHAQRLAETALASGGNHHRIQQVLTFGGMVTPNLRQLVREAFGAEIKDRYSAKETGFLALQCPKHEHYHVLSQMVLIEIVDDAFAPVPAGTPGQVLVTVLHSVAMPLIRYALGDVAVAGAACDCGRTLPVLSRLAGRRAGDATSSDAAAPAGR